MCVDIILRQSRQFACVHLDRTDVFSNVFVKLIPQRRNVALKHPNFLACCRVTVNARAAKSLERFFHHVSLDGCKLGRIYRGDSIKVGAR